MKRFVACGLLLLAFLLSACQQSDNNQSTGSEGEKEEATPTESAQDEEVETTKTEPEEEQSRTLVEALQQVEDLPQTYDELLERDAGFFGGKYFVEHEEEILSHAMENLPKIEQEVTEEELDVYYRNLLSFVQESYTSPESLIQELKFEAFGDPEMEDSRYTFKEQLNIEIILDASGSMAGQVNGRTKMELAKATIQKFVKELPEEANVGLRVYGHKGSGSDQDKKLSCSSSDLVYPIQKYDEQQFNQSLNKFQPAGWTPIGLSLSEAAKDLSKYNGEKNTNIIFLVSDGIDTCDVDPVQEAKKVADSNISPIINIIGFDVDGKGQEQLKEMAKVSEGIYSDVKDETELSKEFNKVHDLAEKWEQWKQQADTNVDLQRVQQNLDIFVYTTKEEEKRLRERSHIYLTISKLWLDKKHITKEAFAYLEDKNIEYHEWMKDEQDAIKSQLTSLNEENYSKAVKELEEHYNSKTSSD